MANKRKGRADGLKTVTFTYNGKRYYCYGHTVKEAKEKAAARKQELESNTLKPTKELSFKEYYAIWEEARSGVVKEATIRKQSIEAAIVSNMVIDDAGTMFGNLRIKDIETQHIRLLQRKLKNEGGTERSTNTVNDYIAFVSHVFHDAVNERAIDWNPCNGVKPLKRVEKPARETFHRALTKEETKAFFEASKASAYYNLYRFLISTGCRVGEAAALTISDIKPDGIQVRRTVTRLSDGSYTIGDNTKTDAGKRFIPMTKAIRDAISDQKEINAALYGNNVINLEDTIFKTSWGNLLLSTNVDRDIKRYCKKAGIEKFTAHAFRDTFATRALESGMNPKTLQSILGHSDFSTTMNVYAHVMEDTKAAEMERVIAI